MSSRSRRAEALAVAEEILTDIELHRMGGLDIARKTSRLARLLDDEQALRWLSYETGGYPPGALEQEASSAARASQRLAKSENGQDLYWTESLGTLEQRVVTGAAELTALASSACQLIGRWSGCVPSHRPGSKRRFRKPGANCSMPSTNESL